MENGDKRNCFRGIQEEKECNYTRKEDGRREKPPQVKSGLEVCGERQ